MIFEKGYLFPPSFLDILETFPKAADRDSLNMAIHRYMYRGEEPNFSNINLKRTWLGIFPYLKKSRSMAVLKDEQDKDQVETTSRPGQDQVKTSSGQGHDIKAIGNGKGSRQLNKGEGEPPIIPQGIAAPSFQDVQEFAKAESLRTDVKKFYNYYSARNWRTNGEPVHDWKALLKVWASRDKAEEKPQPAETYKPITDFKKCPKCGSANTSQQGMYAMCLNPECDKTFTWINNEWREDR